MKTITMYELIGLVKDGKAPKKIKYEDRTYTLYLDEENNHYYQDDKCKYFMLSISCFEELNDEVEILEENKIPEKLRTWYSLEITQSKELNREYMNTNFENMYEKINEICDYLEKSKGE